MQKIIFSLMAFILLLSGACLAEPERLQTSETPRVPEIEHLSGFHEDTVYGYATRYPSEWEAEEGGPAGALLTIHNAAYSCTVQVFREELAQPVILEEYASGIIGNMQRQLAGFRLLEEGKVAMGDDVGYEYDFEGSESGTSLRAKIVCLTEENRAFVVLAAAEAGIYDLVSEKIDGTVYSFRLEEGFSLADVPRDESLILYGLPPITLDPAVVLDTDSALFIQEIFSGLVTLNQDLEIVPDLAESWETSEDGTAYTFHLREDAEFHDGKPVTAGDFKYSIERACDPETASQVAGSYLDDIVGARAKLAGIAEEVEGVEVVDEHTLRIRIDAPKAHFLSKLLYPTSFVLDEENVNSGEDWWRDPNGTGPFEIDTWKKDELLILARSQHYTGELPDVRRVVFRLWGGMPMSMYEGGEIDITWVSGMNIERVLDQANPLNDELVTIPQLSLNYIGFNYTEPPFDDPKVRQAFCHAIDREKIIEVLFKDTVLQAEGILPPGMPGYNEEVEGLDFDPNKAVELIQESTYGSVEELPSITYTTSGRGYVSVLTEALIDMWRKNLGVEVSIRQIDPESYPYILKEEKDQLFDIGWLADYPDPHNFLDLLFHSESGDNIAEYSNPEIDARLQAAREEMDSEVRLRMYREIEQMLVDDAACLPLYFGKDYVLVKPYVNGFTGVPITMPWLKYISLEPHE
ncbi:MAG: peptide ABC transporter substrate-binding protein [Dehalococcoidia bacterium]